MSEKEINAAEISEWLDAQSDFTLEMRAFAYLSELNFDAEHGGTYSDPVTDKPRQFDIRAVAKKEDKIIKIAVECKSLSKSFPLVIQRTPRTERESFHEVLYAYKSPQGICKGISEFDNSKSLRTRFDSQLYPTGIYVGKSSNQIGKKNEKITASDKEIYDKWAQAISSAHDLVTESPYEREKLGLDKTFTVVFPVLVVSDGCLFCVDYDKNGKRITEPKNIDEVDFYIAKEFWKQGQMCAVYAASHLKIVTFAGYQHFTNQIASDIRFWCTVFPNVDQLEERG